MHLNLQTDYALRVLMLLAASGRQMSVDEIARSFGISRNHLAKVAHRLQELGYVAATRGRGGGLKLDVEPQSVTVGSIVRKFENLDGFVECMGPANTCPVIGVCGLQGVLNLALRDFLTRLDGHTLADLLTERKRFMARVLKKAALPG